MKQTSLSRFFYKANRLQQLRGFCRTVELGSMTRAARSLSLSQSAVSLQIQALERELEATLFTRVGPRLQITSEGKLLYELAIEHLRALSNIDVNFRRGRERKEHELLELSANGTCLSFLLPEILKRFFSSHEQCSARITFAEQKQAIEKLVSGKTRVAFLPRRSHLPFPSSVRYLPIYRFPPVLLTRRDHPLARRKNLTLEQISQYPLSLPAEELRVIPNLHQVLQRDSSKRRLRVEFEDWETTRKFIEADMVISVSSDVVLQRNDVLVGTSLSHIFPDVDYGVVIAKGEKLSSNINDLIDAAHQDAKRRKRYFQG